MMKTVQAFTLALLAAAMGMWTSVASANHFTGACAAELADGTGINTAVVGAIACVGKLPS